MSNFDQMGKAELRAACKAAGIPYGKLNNDGMRQALVAAEKSAPKSYTESVAAKATDSGTMQELAGNPALPPVAPQNDLSKFSEQVAKGTVGTRTIEKDRPEQNGIKRPSAGGMCRAVWDELDLIVKASGKQPTAKDVKALAAQKGWNYNNASIELYQWRKFHSITGRQSKAK